MPTMRSLKAALATAAVLCLSFGGRALAQEPIVLKLAHGAPERLSIGQGMERFAKLVDTKSHGRVKVNVYLNGSLYNETTALQALASGAVDFGGASNANWALFTNAFLFMDLPYVFKDEASFDKLLHGWLGNEIKQRLAKKGFRLLMILHNGGFRDIVDNKRAVELPSDLKGLKMRTTASPVEQAMFKNWGAIPTAIDWGEVYTALSSSVVDGEFVMPSWLATAKHYEVLKYGTHEDAVIGIQTLAMMNSRYESLPKYAQQAIDSAAAEAEAYSNKLDDEQRASALATARKDGVKYYTPTAAQMKVWRSTGREIWPQFKSMIDPELMKKIVDSQK